MIDKVSEALIQAVNTGQLSAWVFDTHGSLQGLRPEAHERILRQQETRDIIYTVPS